MSAPVCRCPLSSLLGFHLKDCRLNQEGSLVKHTFVPWPYDKEKQYNASNEPCDMWTGPCSCGAWHTEGR